MVHSHRILHPTHTGFHPGCSTKTALLKATEDLKNALDQGGLAALILLDLSTAFHMVSYPTLLCRLEEAGSKLKWITLFLSNRSFQDSGGPLLSMSHQLKCGVLQGSSLSPTLFNLYLCPLSDMLCPLGFTIASHADDTQVFVSLSTNASSISQKLNLSRAGHQLDGCELPEIKR